MFDRPDELSPTPVKAGDDGRMPPSGHYAGQTSQDGTISFDVSPRGWHVSNLMLTVTARRPHGGSADRPARRDRPGHSGRPGGRWRARVSGEGDRRYRGFLNGSGIKGDLRVDIDSDGGELSTAPHLVRAASRVTAALAAQGLLQTARQRAATERRRDHMRRTITGAGPSGWPGCSRRSFSPAR